MTRKINCELIGVIADLYITHAIASGAMAESQRAWAIQYFKRDPLACFAYVAHEKHKPMLHDLRMPAYHAHLQRRIDRLEAENIELKRLLEARL